jgi:predicted glycosyltransferase
MASVWIDVISPSEALFFSSLMRDLNGHEVVLTAAESAETLPLLELKGASYRKLGLHPTSRGLRRRFRILSRSLECVLNAPRFDVSLSFGDFYAVLTSVMRRRPIISIDDNDKIGKFNLQLSFKRASFVILPEAFPRSKLLKLGMKEEQIIQFPGYKEDVYIADFVPDPEFSSKIPFPRYVVLRPEALFASYVSEKHSMVPDLAAALVKSGFRIVFLPRNEREKTLLRAHPAVFVPENPLNGLDLCWNADAVLTGSGTLAREAALLGVPAVSFFPEQLLSVDQDLVSREMMYHSRDSASIIDYLSGNGRHRQPLSYAKERSGEARALLVTQLQGAIESCLGGAAN